MGGVYEGLGDYATHEPQQFLFATSTTKQAIKSKTSMSLDNTFKFIGHRDSLG